MAELTQPIHEDPRRLVENTYELRPGSQQPDLDSQRYFEEFLRHRFEEDLEPTSVGNWTRVPIDTEQRSSYERSGTFYWGAGNSRRFWTGVLAVNLAVNGFANAGNIGKLAHDSIEQVQNVKDHIEDGLGIGDKCIDVEAGRPAKPGTTSVFNTFVELESVGSSEPSEFGVHRLVDSMLFRQREGKVVEINFTALASDDWGSKPNRGLGVADKENANQLAPERLLKFVGAIKEYGEPKGLDLSKLKASYREVVLPQGAIDTMHAMVGQFGYSSLDQMFGVYNSTPELLPPAARKLFDLEIGNNRGLKVREEIEVPGLPDVLPKTTERQCKPDGSPERHHDYDWDLIPLPLVPLPTFRRRIYEKTLYKWVHVPGEVHDPEFLRLYPEAMDDANQLVDEAWAYARKYQNMMRETDRIKSTYRLDYVDEKGEQQRLRAIFIDHDPTEETVATVASLFQKVSQMQGGRVGRELDMVAIYPIENAGLHGQPKKVGLGLDIQREEEVQGMAYPTLRLVELHMPPKPTKEELKAFNGAEWTMAHEIAGHFTDLNNEPNTLTRVTRFRGMPIYVANNRFADTAEADYDHSMREEQNGALQRLTGRAATPLRWLVRRRLETLNGEVVEHQDEVETTDPRLTEGLFVRIQRFVSRYSRQDASEHYAESSAQIATGTGVPFEEEPEAQANNVQPRESFTGTYAASGSMHRLITRRWGSDQNHDHTEFPNEAEASRNWQHWMGPIDQDPELYQLAEQARLHPLPPERELLHIFTGSRIKASK